MKYSFFLNQPFKVCISFLKHITILMRHISCAQMPHMEWLPHWRVQTQMVRYKDKPIKVSKSPACPPQKIKQNTSTLVKRTHFLIQISHPRKSAKKQNLIPNNRMEKETNMDAMSNFQNTQKMTHSKYKLATFTSLIKMHCYHTSILPSQIHLCQSLCIFKMKNI